MKDRRKLICIALAILLVACPLCVFADTWEFDTDTSFTPRGFLIQNDQGAQWLYSKFDNSSGSVKYTGKDNGVQYIEAAPQDGSSYSFYAVTSEEPSAYEYVTAYKDGAQMGISVGYPQVLEGGSAMQLDGITLEPGCKYEFAFQRGLTAADGLTMVLSADGLGYISNPATQEEQDKYNSDKYNEFEFVAGYKANTDPETGEKTYDVTFVPMRFSVQTYADISVWQTASASAWAFVNSVKETDYTNGTYVRENVAALKTLLEKYDKSAEESVKLELQSKADKLIKGMISDLNEALETAKQHSKADLSKLKLAISRGKSLYADVKDKTGLEVGDYGKKEVDALAAAIAAGEKITENDAQATVDAATKTINDAMTAVKNSKVAEKSITFVDGATGVVVLVPRDSLPDGAKLSVTKHSSSSDIVTAFLKKLGSSADAASVYSISFYVGTTKVTPTEEFEIQLPIDSSIKASTTKAYSVSADGSYSVLTSSRASNYRVFKTTALGEYGIAGSKIKADPTPTKTASPTSKRTSSPTSARTSVPTSSSSYSPTPTVIIIIDPTPEPTPYYSSNHDTKGDGEGDDPADLSDAAPYTPDFQGVPMEELLRPTKASPMLAVAGVLGVAAAGTGAGAFVKDERRKNRRRRRNMRAKDK